MLPQLRQVERMFPNELVVIGVHSAKFPNERNDENLRKAILRYGVEHPVINDKDFGIWRLYGVRAWPTLVLIDPTGRIVGVHEGEITAEQLATVLRQLIAEADAKKLLDRTPLRFQREPQPDTPLRFPGKVLADGKNDQLFIADTGHHRIVVTDFEGQVLMVIGSGQEGLRDGDFKTAQFNSPHGLALQGDQLFVADTGNHCIRRVDLTKKTVTTIAGTGKLGRSFSQGGKARELNLRSPWDVAIHDGNLYIAMAGSHQLWVMDLKRGILTPFAGTGYEGIRDGAPNEAWLAQPSGLSIGEDGLYFADSETSAVRVADLKTGFVRTLVGVGLFDFGDRDGIGSTVRLQHPLAVCYHEGVVYVADTYNHKIKRLFPKTRTCQTFAGTGKPGHKDGILSQAQFDEPSGISYADGKLFVADTNNHAVRVIDLRKGEVQTLKVKLRD
nr:thioredoxin-like domain-containing protein [Candidatus Fervidibacter sacchari]